MIYGIYLFFFAVVVYLFRKHTRLGWVLSYFMGLFLGLILTILFVNLLNYPIYLVLIFSTILIALFVDRLLKSGIIEESSNEIIIQGEHDNEESD